MDITGFKSRDNIEDLSSNEHCSKFLLNSSINYSKNINNSLLMDKISCESEEGTGKSNINKFENFYDKEESIISINNPKDNINVNINNYSKKILFEVIYPKKYILFTHLRSESCRTFDDDYSFQRKRSLLRIRRGRNSDHFRLMIKRNFFNKTLLNCLNEKLENIRYKNKFKKFPQYFVSDITKKNNKQFVHMTLAQIFEQKSLYKSKHDLLNYQNNLKILDRLKKENNLLMRTILNMKYKDIFEEYVNSDEFLNDIDLVRKRFKLNNFDYERYINISKTFIQFCTK